MSESPVLVSESASSPTTQEAKAEEPAKPLVNLTEWYSTQQEPIQMVLQKEAVKDSTDDHFESMVKMMLLGKNYDESSLPVFRVFLSTLAAVSNDPPTSPKSGAKKKGGGKKGKANKSATAAAKAAKAKSSQKAKVTKSANDAAFEATAQRQRKESVTQAARAAAKVAVSGKMKSAKASKRPKMDPKKLVNSEVRSKGKAKAKAKEKANAKKKGARQTRSRTRGDLGVSKPKHHRAGSAQATRTPRSPRNRPKSPREGSKKSNLNVRKAARQKSRTVGVDEAPDLSQIARSNSAKRGKKHEKRLSGITISDETGTIQSTKKWRPIDYQLVDDGRSFLDEKQAERGDHLIKDAEFRKDPRREWPDSTTLKRSNSARDEYGIRKRKTSPNPVSMETRARMSIALEDIPASPITPNTPDYDDDAYLKTQDKFARNMRRAKSTGDVGATMELDEFGNLKKSNAPGKLDMSAFQHLKHISLNLSNNFMMPLKEDANDKFSQRKSASDQNVHS